MTINQSVKQTHQVSGNDGGRELVTVRAGGGGVPRVADHFLLGHLTCLLDALPCVRVEACPGGLVGRRPVNAKQLACEAATEAGKQTHRQL